VLAALHKQCAGNRPEREYDHVIRDNRSVSGTLAVRRERIERSVLRLRGQNVMLDEDLAALYGVSVKALNQAVKRNRERFPSDFMFRLTKREAQTLRSQIVTAKTGSGGRRSAPYAFTELGVAMLSSVLRSDLAIHMNIQIMRAFVVLRRVLESHGTLADKIDELQEKYDRKFAIVLEAIRKLMKPPASTRGRIGFRA
jgi:ORF6N domain-containing protein